MDTNRLPCIDIQCDAISMAADSHNYHTHLGEEDPEMHRTWKVEGKIATVTYFDKGNGWSSIETVETASDLNDQKFAEALWHNVLNWEQTGWQHRKMLAEHISDRKSEEAECQCAERLNEWENAGKETFSFDFENSNLPCIDIQRDAIAVAAGVTSLQYLGEDHPDMYRTFLAKSELVTITIFDKGNWWAAIDEVKAESQEKYDQFVESLWDQVLNKAKYPEQTIEMLRNSTKHCQRNGGCYCANRLEKAHQR